MHRHILPALFTGICVMMQCIAFSQTDSLPKAADTIAPQKKNSLLKKVIDQFKKDTTEVDKAADLKRNEEVFKPYDGKIIRHIYVNRLPFGISLSDTTRKFMNSMTNLANELHHLTKVKVIYNNLFFKEGQPLKPFLMADNARYLRQLLYVQDADFKISPASPVSDSVDVTVEVKDVFSLGGAVNSLGLKKSNIEFREDNFAGSGNAAVLFGLYDAARSSPFAFGGEYKNRNIKGTFIDGTIGYQSFYPTLNGPRDDNYYYLNFVKPLENRYMRWTYELDLSYHNTRNRYPADTLYYSYTRSRYYNIEGWIGFNLNGQDFTTDEESRKLRSLIGIRYITRQFQAVPEKYESAYNWQYADLRGVLSTLTFYRQNFYKTQYIYGFGRNEDIPEGVLLSFTAGYTVKQNRERPFIGFNYQHYQFNQQQNYLSYNLSAEGFLNHKKLEDVNAMAGINYFDHLKLLGSKWKQRFFLDLDIAKQVNTVLNEPLFAYSQFAFPEYGIDKNGGNFRITAKAESAFFSPWTLLSFKFAPFVFGNAGVFSPYASPTKVLSAVGGGIRTRNESFVFGTIELRGFYFPRKNSLDESFRFTLSTNVIFKYNSEFVKKPDFIQVN